MTTRSRSDIAKTEPLQSSPPPDVTPKTTRSGLLASASIPVALRFPLLVVLAVVVLGSLALSGSSAALHSPSGDVGLVAGRARSLRSDEWGVRTPLVARQAALGFPEHDDIGVGNHDMAVVSDVPTGGWEVLVRPHTFPYHVLGIERAFAFEWWINFLALPALGVYALGLALGLRPLTATLIGLIVALSPFVQWWTGSWTGTIGYGCLAGAALIAATKARSAWSRVGLAAGAGWLGSCLVVVLYPSTVIPMALLVAVVVVAAIARSIPPRGRRQNWWRGLFIVGSVACVVGGLLLGAFLLAHRETLDIVANTVYPGRRRHAGGGGNLYVLFGAPFDLVESTQSAGSVLVNGFNQSEASASLFTILAVGAAVVTDRNRHPLKPWRSRVVLVGILAASLVMLAWYALPIPESVGHFFLFDRVRPDRLLLPLAAASALALGLFFEEQRRTKRKIHPVALCIGTAMFAIPTLWAGFRLRINGEIPPRWQVLLLATAATVGVALALRGARVGLWLLVGLFAATAAAINPLQHGLAALVDGPAAQLGRELRARPGAGAVLDMGVTARGGLTASGVKLVSGVNLYPNAKAWRILDPNDSERQAWDSYNNAVWNPGPAGSTPQIQGTGDTVSVTVDPCDARLRKLGVGTIVSVQPLPLPCLVATDRVAGDNGLTVYAYRIVRS